MGIIGVTMWLLGPPDPSGRVGGLGFNGLGSGFGV